MVVLATASDAQGEVTSCGTIWQPVSMTQTGGSGSHRWEVAGTLTGYFWACSCGASSEPVYGSEQQAIKAVEEHATRT